MPATARSRRPKFQEIGATGLRIWAGRIYEEWLQELTGEKGRRVLREMAEQDPTIGGILFSIEQLVRQVQWTFTPKDDTQEAKDAADFAQSCLDDMQPHWQDTLSEILSMLPYGWSWLEVVYKYRQGPNDDAQLTSKFDDGKVGWRTWGIRSQETLLQWERDDQGKITAMTQQPPPDYKTRTIPLSKSLHFRTKSRKDNPEGVSVLRSAYRPWYFKKHVETIEGIGIERDLAGLPVMWVPPELLAQNATDEQKQLLAELQKIVTNIRRDEQEGVLMPLQYDDQGRERYKLQLISTGGQRQFDTDKIIQRYDQRIAMTLMADFVLLGHEQVGSFALSDSKTALFATALGAWLDSICNTITTFEMPRLFKMNGLDVKLVPQLTHSDIENADLGKLGTYLQALAAAGMTVFPNPMIEKHLLEQAGIPVPDELPSQTEAMVQQAMQELGLVDQMGNPIEEEEPPPNGPESNSPATLRQKKRTTPQGAAEAAGKPMRTPKGFAATERDEGSDGPETEQFFNPYHARKTGRFDFNPMGTSTIVGGSLVKQFGGQAAAIRELHARGKRPAEIARLLGVRPQAVHGQLKKVRDKAAAAAGAPGGIGHTPAAKVVQTSVKHPDVQRLVRLDGPAPTRGVALGRREAGQAKGPAKVFDIQTGTTSHGGENLGPGVHRVGHNARMAKAAAAAAKPTHVDTSHGGAKFPDGKTMGVHGPGHFGTGPTTAALRMGPGKLPAAADPTSHGGPKGAPTFLKTSGGQHQVGHSKRQAAVAAGKQEPGPGHGGVTVNVPTPVANRIANPKPVKVATGPMTKAGFPAKAATAKTSHGGLGSAEAGKRAMAGEFRTVHGPGHQKMPLAVKAHGAAAPKKLAQEGDKLNVNVGGQVKPGREVIGSTMGAARVRGQRLQPAGRQDRKYSTGDEQAVNVFKTSHGGQVAVNITSGGGAGGIHSIDRGAGHKGGDVARTSHGGRVVKGKGGRIRAEEHAVVHEASAQRKAEAAKVAREAAKTSHGGVGTRQHQADRAAAPFEQNLTPAHGPKHAEAARLPGTSHGGLGSTGKRAGTAGAQLKAQVVGGQKIHGPGHAEGHLAHDRMDAHVKIIDAVGHGKVSGPITDVQKLGGGISESHKGKINGEQVIIKPVAGEPMFAVRGHAIPVGNAAGREVAGGIMSKHMEDGGAKIGAQRGTVRDTPKGVAFVGNFVGTHDDGAGAQQHHAVFDAVIGNTDRHGGNWRSDGKGNIYPIDHGLAFPSSKNYAGGNANWMSKFGGQPLSPTSKGALLHIQKNAAKIRADIEPLVGKKATDLMFERVDHMLKSGQVMHAHELLDGTYGKAKSFVSIHQPRAFAPLGQAAAHQRRNVGFGRQRPAGAATRARRNRGEMLQKQVKRQLQPAERQRLMSAQQKLAQFGLPTHARGAGIRQWDRLVMNRRGRVGWWKRTPEGRWQWVDLQPGRH